MIKTEIRTERREFSGRIDLIIFQRLDDGRRAIADPMTLKIMEEGYIINPTATLSMEEAQVLMDDLWRCGLRPSEGSGSAGSLAATERHLKDMQTITKGLLKKDGIEL